MSEETWKNYRYFDFFKLPFLLNERFFETHFLKNYSFFTEQTILSKKLLYCMIFHWENKYMENELKFKEPTKWVVHEQWTKEMTKEYVNLRYGQGMCTALEMGQPILAGLFLSNTGKGGYHPPPLWFWGGSGKHPHPLPWKR